MASISQAKTYGMVGSILVLLSAVPSVGGLLGIVGFILILLAVKNISDVFSDKSIFNNMLIAVGLAIVGIIAGTVLIVASFFSFVGFSNMSTFGPNFNPNTVSSGDWLGLIAGALVGLVIVWITLSVSAIFLRRSYTSIGARLNVKMFGTAGLLYLIGAALTIILVGFVLIFVAEILLVIAFFSIDDKATIAPGTVQQTAPGTV